MNEYKLREPLDSEVDRLSLHTPLYLEGRRNICDPKSLSLSEVNRAIEARARVYADDPTSAKQ